MRLRKSGSIATLFDLMGSVTHSSGELNYSKDQINDLLTGFAGTVTVPFDPGYNAARQLFVATFQHYPQLIAYCHVESDVIKAIKFARETGLKPVCRSGGHSTAGFSANDDMIIDLSNLSYVLIDKDSMTMRVGGGTVFGCINPMMDAYGVNITGGGCETVSVGGYMQGGGYGFTALSNGMNCDCVREVRVALADGSVVTASDREHPNLFWAVRGGTGNNFGVILEITYNLRKIGALWGFGFYWPLDTAADRSRAARAMKLWYDTMTGSGVPKGLGHQLPLAFWNGKPFLFLRGLYEGSQAEAEAVLAGITATLEDPVKQRDYWQAGSYAKLNRELLSTPVELPSVPPSIRSVSSSRIMGDDLGVTDFETIIRLFTESPVKVNMFVLEPYGGQINAKDPAETAFVHRRARFDLAVYSFWLVEDDRAAALSFLDRFKEVLTPISTGHAYQNYPNRAADNWAELYFGANLQRLRDVKAEYDRENLFTFIQGILPAQ